MTAEVLDRFGGSTRHSSLRDLLLALNLKLNRKIKARTVVRASETTLRVKIYCKGLLAEVAAVVGSYRITPDWSVKKPRWPDVPRLVGFAATE